MQEGLGSAAEQRKAVPFNWTLNIATQEFSYDREATHPFLFPNHSINSFGDWLALMSPSYRHDIEQLLESVCQDQHKRTCVVALWEDRHHGFYASFSAEKLSQYVVQGETQLIFEVKQDRQTMHWFDFMLRQDNCGVLITNSENKILACNKKFEQLSGFGLGDLVSLNSILLFEEDPSSLKTPKPSASRNFLIKHSSGELRQCRAASISLAFLQHPDISFTIFSLLPSIKHSIESSILTKKAFGDQLDVIYQRQIANTIYVVMTLSIESRISNFENTLNDVMARLKKCRMFGKIKDNFYLACIECSAPVNEKPYRYLHRQINYFFQELKSSHSEIYQSVAKGRVGISVLGVDASNAKMAVTHSVQAILEQHSEDRGQHIRFFDSDLHRQIKKRKLLEELISDLIETKQVEIKYQPILDTQSWNISGYEARFELPLPPALSSTRVELESIIQDLNLSAELDVIVQEKVFKEQALLQSYHSSPITVTLNILCQHEAKNFVDVLYCLVRQMRDYKVDPHQFYLQVAPDALRSIATQDINMWQQLGIKFVMDNVEISNTISTSLPTERYNLFKINPNYLESLAHSQMIHKVIKTLVDECHSLNVSVAIDTVAAINDAKLLAYLGLDYMSGGCFSGPESVDAIPTVIKKIESLKPSLLKDEGVVGKNISTLQNLCHAQMPHLDPSDTVAAAQQYFLSSEIEVLPVINHRECVGIIDRACLNLHLTPRMGTDLETTQENLMWHRPVSQIMQLSFTKLDAKMDISNVSSLIEEEELAFPWVLTEGKIFKGIVTPNCVIQHFASSYLKRNS
ncbi:hypothetical protein C1N32_11380 [Vibrio diazotrophicus]|uniref:EAL domain-containing protein n=1 Tax=Vibrio diazotrophicus TaxID=685 RepID=A0A2J8I1Y2_VIBDI|nr:EAL domain-containing protein [Vibrio diazotrophicus]PNI04481.1 hypothetical protein C1N32_11380 [Vibrio diazotrophicus]